MKEDVYNTAIWHWSSITYMTNSHKIIKRKRKKSNLAEKEAKTVIGNERAFINGQYTYEEMTHFTRD